MKQLSKHIYTRTNSRYRRWGINLCILFIIFALIRLIFAVTGFPRDHFIGDFLINEGYLSPNVDTLTAITNGHVHSHYKLSHLNATVMGVARDVADGLPSVLQQVYYRHTGILICICVIMYINLIVNYI